MTLNIKNLFKKICVLGASATMAMGLCAPLANATPPTDGVTVGGKYNDFASIGNNGDLTLIPVIITRKNIYYDNSQNNLIDTNSNAEGTDGGITVKTSEGTSLKKNNDDGSGVAMYVRAVKQGDDPRTNIVWHKVWQGGKTIGGDTNGVGNGSVKGQAAGKYDIYYYIDGNDYIDENGKRYQDSYSDIINS